MGFKMYICIIFIMIHLVSVQCKKKNPKTFNETKQKPRFSNPDNVRDRYKYFYKPQLNETWLQDRSRLHVPWNPVYMDYCDPYHCNAYHKSACGLNRKTLRFKWFQSVCHLILNNKCSTYRGQLKYDYVESKYCMAYVMIVRTNCQPCISEAESPICALSMTDYHTVMFKNKCAMKTANCQPATLDEYKEVEMQVCTLFQVLNMDVDVYNPMESRLYF